MLNIVVFDDNEMELSVTFDILNDFIKQENMEAKIQIFIDKDEAIQYITEKKVDIVFLDILVNEQTLGIEMAKEINTLSEDTQIVFLTGYLHYATDIYDTRHIYYVLKTELRQRLPGVFAKIEKVLDSQNIGIIHIKQGAKDLILEKKDIYYIERNKRISYIHCSEQVYTVNEKLSDVEQMVGHFDFVRCHNSYIINLQHVLRVERTAIFLKDGTQIPISRSYKEEVQKRFLEWLQKYM